MISKHPMNTTIARILDGTLDEFLASHPVCFYVIEADTMRIVTGSTCNVRKRFSDAYVKALGDKNVSLYPLQGDEYERAIQLFIAEKNWSKTLAPVQLKIERDVQAFIGDYFDSCPLANETFIDCYFDEVTDRIEASTRQMEFHSLWRSLAPRQKIALRNKANNVGLNALQQNDFEILSVSFPEMINDLITFAKFN